MAPLPGPLLHTLASPRKHRIKHRTALIALASLFTFTCYLLFIAYPSLILLTHHDRHENPGPKQPTPPLRRPSHHLQPIAPPRPPLALSPTEELATLSAFIAAHPHNVLPPSVDPTAPLDPQLVLDFDPRSESARHELLRLVDETWSRFPVMLYTKHHSSDAREVRHLLDDMHLDPAPLVIEVDQREDAHVLMPILTRLTHVPGLPVLLVGGQAVASDAPDAKGVMAEIRRLHESGELTRRAFEAGASTTVKSGKKKGINRQRRD